MKLHPEVAENRPAIEATPLLPADSLTKLYLDVVAPQDRLVVTDRPADWGSDAVWDRDSSAVDQRVGALVHRPDPGTRPAAIVFDTDNRDEPTIARAVTDACRHSRKANCRIVLRSVVTEPT